MSSIFGHNQCLSELLSHAKPCNVFYVPHEQERTNFSQNAFSQALCDHGFNFYQMFAVDLLHDFELGVWKGIFAHLI